MHISLARLASFCRLGFISDPLIVSKFHNETHDPKGLENKIYTIVKGRETFYRRHTYVYTIIRYPSRNLPSTKLSNTLLEFSPFSCFSYQPMSTKLSNTLLEFSPSAVSSINLIVYTIIRYPSRVLSLQLFLPSTNVFKIIKYPSGVLSLQLFLLSTYV